MAEQQDVVVITGCTIGGIGHALALAFAERKCQVVATARSLASMEGLDKKHSGLHLLELDVCSDQSVADAVRAVVDKYGRIDVLVNNAGVPCVGPLAELPLALIQSTFDTNVYGLMRVIKAVVPHMISRAKGKIVNIGSVAAFSHVPWGGAYNASKAAVHSLSDCLRVELKPFGIDVITVAPGAIKSNIGSNCSTIYKKNPEWKFYKPFEKAIYGTAEFSQQPGNTPTEVFANKTADVILRRKPPAWFSYAGVEIPMMATENYSKIDVSSSRNEAGEINELQEVYGADAIDMPVMEAITHNKKGVSSSVNGTGQSGEKQEIQGALVDIQKMDAGIPINTDVIIRSVRQAKKKKLLDDQNATLYAKW